MAEKLIPVPKHGILKATRSYEHREADSSKQKRFHFDESNISATLNPPDKDYGFTKIEEPKTPFEYSSDDEKDGTFSTGDSSENRDGKHITSGSRGKLKDDPLDAQLLAARIPVRRPSADKEDLDLLSPEEREKRRKFEQKRKEFYDEFHVAKIAQQSLNDRDQSDEEK